jgi:group II intron reverse transcriptase/maturase
MATNLIRIGVKAKKERKLVFTSLYHHVYDVDNLRACFHALKPKKAVGVDKVTKEEYGENLEENLKVLSARLKRMGYRPGLRRRSYVPKSGSAKGRPLGIGNFEDKIVELAMKRTLEPIYEADFEESSYGYRPQRNPHRCVDDLGRTIQQNWINYVVEADIRSFFDKVNHEWMIQFLEHRIGDRRVIRLIIRMLKSGILDEGLVKAPTEGTPQGSILSPLLSNVYLHYVLDLWFNKKVKKGCEGQAFIFRYADDFVCCFQRKTEAKLFLGQLRERMSKFGLQLAEEKTKLLAFGCFARKDAQARGRKPEEFTFLGFTHYCGKSRNQNFKVKRRTSRQKQIQSLRKFTDWIMKAYWRMRKGDMLRSAKRRLIGHLNYYGITDNSNWCDRYIYYATRILFKWINRKSQRRAYNWEQFRDALAYVGWPEADIRKNLNPYRV